MVHVETFESRRQWLKGREGRIGGSEAAACVGLNPWMSNVDLWKIKTGRMKKSIGNPAAAEYGNRAEPLIRELFILDNPQLTVEYIEHNIYTNDDFPWAHASLDGSYTTEGGDFGVLEIKTAAINSSVAYAKWNNQIPDNYYCQICHYLAVTEAQEATLRALLTFYDGKKEIRDYHFNAIDCAADIDYLMEQEEKLYKAIQNDTEPNLILNL